MILRAYLTHFQPMLYFYTPQNITKPPVFCFQGAHKCNIGWKWVNTKIHYWKKLGKVNMVKTKKLLKGFWSGSRLSLDIAIRKLFLGVY